MQFRLLPEAFCKWKSIVQWLIIACDNFNRFVRFVSTPEILERVYTIECEIVQIEKAVAMQGNNDIGTDIVRIFPTFLIN